LDFHSELPMHFAQRVQQLPPYLFAEISRKIAAKRAQGVEVISFGIGDPDLPTPPHVIDALKRFDAEVREGRFPDAEHSFPMKESERLALEESLKSRKAG